MTASHASFRPYLLTIVGIALFSAMDAVIKSASIAVGAYSAYLLRCIIGFMLIAPVWWFTARRRPVRAAVRVHLVRGVVVAFMGWTFFAALVRLPLSEAIAISFISPLIALYLAGILLKEKIERKAVYAAFLGLCGVLIIVGGKLARGGLDQSSLFGLTLIVGSALLYAWNLVLQRQQAILAGPAEVSMFQNGVVALVLAVGSPFLLKFPQGVVWLEITAGAALAVLAALCLTWAYARAGAQQLVPIEYTGLLWASLFGWMFFSENVTVSTALGSILIVFGCWIATRRPTEPTAV